MADFDVAKRISVFSRNLLPIGDRGRQWPPLYTTVNKSEQQFSLAAGSRPVCVFGYVIANKVRLCAIVYGDITSYVDKIFV